MISFGDMFEAETKFFDGWSDDEPLYFYPVVITKDFGGLNVGQKFAVVKFIRRECKLQFYDDMEDVVPVKECVIEDVPKMNVFF